MIRLIVKTPFNEAMVIPLRKDMIIIGRDGSCDISIPWFTVSSKHARLRINGAGDSISLTDLNSTNGTFLETDVCRALEPYKETRIGLDSTFFLGPDTPAFLYFKPLSLRIREKSADELTVEDYEKGKAEQGIMPDGLRTLRPSILHSDHDDTEQLNFLQHELFSSGLLNPLQAAFPFLARQLCRFMHPNSGRGFLYLNPEIVTQVTPEDHIFHYGYKYAEKITIPSGLKKKTGEAEGPLLFHYGSAGTRKSGLIMSLKTLPAFEREQGYLYLEAPSGSLVYRRNRIVAELYQSIVAQINLILQLNELTVRNSLSAAGASSRIIIGDSSEMRALRHRIVAAGKDRNITPVMIIGDTGTGKELVAREIHNTSRNNLGRTGEFIAWNCALGTDDLIDSHWFGIEKNVATGVAERQGIFELSQDGTLFLDEIDKLKPEFQGKLLRVLQERSFQRVGGENHRLPFNARVISASGKRLAELKSNDAPISRELFYRLKGFCLEIPTLEERHEDIPKLGRNFTENFGSAYGINHIQNDALELLQQKKWDGNIRELEQTLCVAVSFAGLRKASFVAAKDVMDAFDAVGGKISKPSLPTDEVFHFTECYSLKEEVQTLERKRIISALKQTGGNVRQASRLLGVSEKETRTRVQKYGLKD